MVHLTEERKDEEAKPVNFSKLRIVKNVFVLCLIFILAFTAYDCLSMLQSTLNHKQGIGVISQATNYGCYCITSLILPKYVIKKLGCKLTLVFSMIFYLPYIVSNFYPRWFVMVPMAIINGISGCLLWGAQAQYLNEIAVEYAIQSIDDVNKKKQQKSESEKITIISEKTPPPSLETNFVLTNFSECNKQNVTGVANGDTSQNTVSNIQKENSKFISNIAPKDNSIWNKDSDKESEKTTNQITLRSNIESTTAIFFGIHGLAYLSVHMWSNIMAYFILQSNTVYSNVTLNSSCTCGANFCSEKSDCLVNNLQEPTSENRYLLTGILVALILVSIIIMIFFLDSLNDRQRDVCFSLDFLLATGKQMKNKKQILLTPISLYFGLIQGYYMGEFNLSFVGCAWGTSHVALVSACYGAACAFSSPVSGWLVKLIGRIPIITFAMLLHVAAQILLINWTPSSEKPAMFFVLAALWGSTVGILYSQIKAMYGFLFKSNQEAAFGAFHVWAALGICLSFAYSNHLCAYVKIYTLSTILIVGFLGYISLEVLLRLKLKKAIS